MLLSPVNRKKNDDKKCCKSANPDWHWPIESIKWWWYSMMFNRKNEYDNQVRWLLAQCYSNLPWPRYISLAGTHPCAPICERGVLPCTADGESWSSWSWLVDLPERWTAEDDRTDDGWSWLVLSSRASKFAPSFSAMESPRLTLNPLAPDSTSLPVDDSTWQIYVSTSRQRAGMGIL